MNVFRIWTTRKTPSGNPVYIDLECGFASIEAIVDKLNAGQFITGNQLWTRFSRDENGDKVLEITEHRPTAIGPQGVANIETPVMRYVRYVDEAAQ